IKLIPKPGSSMYEQYRTVEFWVAREDAKLSGLPVRVRAAKKDPTGRISSYIVVAFSDVELNAGLGGAVFKIEKPADYNVDEHRLDESSKIEDIKIEDMKPAE